MPDSSKIDIAYLAKTLGLARSTVSKALNNRPGASQETREKVDRLVKELNYSPNHFAKALKLNKSNLIAFVMPEMSYDFFTDVAKSIVAESKRHGYHAIFTSSENSQEEEISIIKDIFNRHIDGLIIMPSANCNRAGLKKVLENHPCVVIDNYIKEVNAPFVGTDFREGMYSATSHLIQNGHKNIGLLLGPHDLYSTPERKDGYSAALNDAGIKFSDNYVASGPYTRESGCKNAKALLQKNPELTAVLCSNIALGEGAVAAINGLGLRIPDDISIIDFGGKSLTSVDLKSEEIGKVATQTLFRVIDGDCINAKIAIKPGIVEQSSVKKISGDNT